MKIAMIGSGYVGLVSGACFADFGHDVVCVDKDASKIERLNANIMPIYEPGLDALVKTNVDAGRLKFSTDLKASVDGCDAVFIAVGTPSRRGDGHADLSYVYAAAQELAGAIGPKTVVVTKSTVPVGTGDEVERIIADTNPTLEFAVVSNPEFLREGFAVHDFMKPDRVVVGTSSERAKKVMEDLYKPFVRQGNPILFMDEKSSELTKYAANSFLATKISFMNEIANLCEKVGADVDKVRIGIGSDDRIGKRFLFAGIGYGGSCFPKDVQALAKSSDDNKYDFKILKSVMEVNKRQRELFLDKIKKQIKSLKGKKIAVWGLAFKPDTDDIREAPALYLIERLLAAGAKISAYDPEAMSNTKKIFGEKIFLGNTHYEVLKNADALVICTEWPVFRTPDFDEMKKLMKSKTIFDGRNLYSKEQMKELGFNYFSIGR